MQEHEQINTVALPALWSCHVLIESAWRRGVRDDNNSKKLAFQELLNAAITRKVVFFSKLINFVS